MKHLVLTFNFYLHHENKEEIIVLKEKKSLIF